MARIGLLHPGQMGVAVGHTLTNSGHEVLWTSEGRSPQTRNRASRFTHAITLRALVDSSELIVSVCPPEFAPAVAASVAELGYRGLYADVNATSPQTKHAIARHFPGERFVDGGIIGMPPQTRGRTWLYLSGPKAKEVASHFTAGPLEVEVMGEEIGKASALKMCFAGWSKGATALIAAVMGAAQELDVLDHLKTCWSRGGSTGEKAEQDLLRAAPKAWRFTGEMREIASTLESAGMPGGFHRAAEDLYERLREFKDTENIQLTDILQRLAASGLVDC